MILSENTGSGLSSHRQGGCLDDRQVASFALSQYFSLLMVHICLLAKSACLVQRKITNISGHHNNAYFINISIMLNVSFILWRAEACASFKGSI